MADPDRTVDPAPSLPGAEPVQPDAPGQADADALLAASGRLAWLEAVRGASRLVRHDLANVLTGISFYASELEAELPDGTAAARATGAIGDELARAAQLLDRLLVLWRDPAEADVQPLDPAAVVDALTPLLTAVAAPAELVVGPLDSVVVRASRRAIEEALLVLVVDARAFGGPIRVGVEKIAAGDARGLPGTRSAAVRVGQDASPARSRASGETAGPNDGAAGRSSLQAEAGTHLALGMALAEAAARAAGGTARAEPRPDGTATTILLLPEAVSRRRGPIGGTETPGVG